jgi:hypothetical protein
MPQKEMINIKDVIKGGTINKKYSTVMSSNDRELGR